ncbi:flagellar protein [candidate division KSB1 bacterium]|nr:MAG: flagellar protein [candidate division KSB1 bacterium]
MKTPSVGLNPEIRFSISGIENKKLSRPEQKTNKKNSFNEVFKSELLKKGGIKFSGHAAQRIDCRNLSIGYSEILRLNTAVRKAEEKGVKESLVLMNDMAFIVNIKNRTIITAIDRDSMKEKVFTNIDSTIII